MKAFPLATLAFFSALAPIPCLSQIMFQATPLGTLGGWTMPFDINNAGQVVGHSKNAQNIERAFLWSPTRPNGPTGSMQDLGTLGGNGSYAAAINNAGQVTGFGNTATGSNFAFLWTPSTPNGASGSMLDLGAMGGAFSAARGLNDFGQVVGRVDPPAGSPRAFLWTPTTPNGTVGSMQDLGTLGGWSSDAADVNNQGQVVGASSNGTGQTRAFIWNPTSPNGTSGSMQELGGLPGQQTVGTSINEAGVTTGIRYSINTTALWSEGTAQTLGALTYRESSPEGMNNNGWIVGYLTMGGDSERAFLWTPGGGMQDLTSLISNPEVLPNGFLKSAFGINDHGQIVGETWGQAFLLTPVPEPGAWAALGALGALGYGLARRARSIRASTHECP